MAQLLQQQRTARDAGRARRRASRFTTRYATPASPSPVRADDSTPAPHGGAAWERVNSVSAAAQGTAETGVTAAQTADGCGALVKRKDGRLRLRDGIQGFTGLRSVGACERVPLGEAVGIRAVAGEAVGFSGLVRCGSVWACPVCAARVRGERAATLERYALAWLKSGRGLYLVTLTVPHWSHVRLADYTDDKGRQVKGQLSKLLEAWRGIGQGAWWTGRAVIRDKAPAPWSSSWAGDDTVKPRTLEDGRVVVWRKGFTDRYEVAGTTRTAEVTDGANGWHSHLHALVWTEGPATRETAESMQAALYGRWAKRCKSVGLPTPDPKRGCRVDPATRDEAGQKALARYVAKVQEQRPDGTETARGLASELTRGDVKLARGAKGRTPFDLAALAVAGDDAARLRWLEYERATQGRRCLTWSHGLQERLAALVGDEVDERTDEELAAELAEAEARGANLAVAGRPFREAVVQRHGGRADIAMAGYVGGLPAVESLLTGWGLVSGVDFWRLDPLGPGLPTSGAQITRARETREAREARLRAAEDGVMSRTPQQWAAQQERRREAQGLQDWHRANRLRAVQKGRDGDEVADPEQDRAEAHADFRARLRAVKASRAV
ncbi:hypothetical protein SUDANB132_06366 (plasmid) [Streptomyces sp. enrichment culture]